MPDQPAKITFRVQAPPINSAHKTIFIAGNHALLGDWQPDLVPLARIEDGLWELQLELPRATDLAFRFTRGSWHTEEVVRSGEVRGNRYHYVQGDQVLELKVNNWRDILFRARRKMVGQVRHHRGVTTGLLKHKRDVIVWLPPGYDKEPDCHYPVLYMHDGQNLFDPATAFAGVDWRMDETATRLSKRGKMQEIIIVGIYNTPARLEEYADTKTGRNYMRFLVEELKPLIDKTYRTLPQREHTAVMGSSMGGLVSLYLVWKYPDIFSKAGCLSTSLSWRDRQVLKFIAAPAQAVPQDVKIYFDHGGLGEEGKYAADYLKLRDLFVEKGLRPDVDFKYYFDKKGDHSERSWARRVKRPLLFLFGRCWRGRSPC